MSYTTPFFVRRGVPPFNLSQNPQKDVTTLMSSFVEMRTLLVYRDEPKDMSSGWVTVGPTRKGSVEGDFSLSVLWTSGSRLDDRLGEKK